MTFARMWLFVALTAISAASPARGAMIVTAIETGGDVVLSGTGSLTFAADVTLGGSVNHALRPSAYVFVGGVGVPSNDVDWYNELGVGGPAAFGSGPAVFATSGSGDAFGIAFGLTDDFVVAPVGYVPGTPLSGSSTYAGHTFASLGIFPGTYTWTWSTDSITLIVPEPSTGTLLTLALALAFAARRR